MDTDRSWGDPLRIKGSSFSRLPWELRWAVELVAAAGRLITRSHAAATAPEPAAKYATASPFIPPEFELPWQGTAVT